MSKQQYSKDLDKNAANYSPLSPLTFIERAASVYPDRCALIYNDTRRKRFRDYLQHRRAAYLLERRWPDEPFWQRRSCEQLRASA